MCLSAAFLSTTALRRSAYPSTYACLKARAKVEIRVKGHERIITPIGQTWDSFFLNGPRVSEDFLPERASQVQGEREDL